MNNPTENSNQSQKNFINISSDPMSNQINEPTFHSSQAKRPFINFGNFGQNILDISNFQEANQSFNITKGFNISQNSKNILSNNDANNDNSNTSNNLAFYNKSVQQEKYDSIKNFCIKKNDPENYPLISYENFLLIDGLCEKNSSINDSYQNFLLNKNATIELYSKFCTLLMNRYILSKQNSNINKYPKVVYHIIFDINNIYNYLSPDIVSDAKESNMFMVLIYYENLWNLAVFNQNNNFGIYFMFNKNMNKNIIMDLMNTIKKEVYPEKNFEYTVSDYSGFSAGNRTILPFIIMDFYSRYKNNLPIDDEDYYYQTILILSEILTNNLITK